MKKKWIYGSVATAACITLVGGVWMMTSTHRETTYGYHKVEEPLRLPQTFAAGEMGLPENEKFAPKLPGRGGKKRVAGPDENTIFRQPPAYPYHHREEAVMDHISFGDGGGGGLEAEEVGKELSTESYARIQENVFLAVTQNPLSTFSIDVDTASYSNLRRYIQQERRLPPQDLVRVEELINYFHYDYADPVGEHPFSLHTEIGKCPWNGEHHLVHIGLQGKNIPVEKLPKSNLVFLIDVSGSMEASNKLGLVKRSLRMLVETMRPQDRVAIVVYAGAAGLVLPSTSFQEKETILHAIEGLHAGGSTAGGAGIKLAYQVAQENFIKEGNNRVILCTDGDFNVGASSDAEMERLIEEKRKTGVALTVLGYGRGNYKDSKMEALADKGNGNYAYVDTLLEAKKVLVNEVGGTLMTIAKDVKIQVEFNPAHVKGYRLIGYENRLLAAQDFDDDTKDAGELGAGHTVTALYEIIPAGSKEEIKQAGALKYQKTGIKPSALDSDELMTVKLRYKPPQEEKSKLIEHPLVEKKDLGKVSDNFTFAAAVAEFGMLLRDSKYKGTATYDQVIELAQQALGKDEEGYRQGFLELVQQTKLLEQWEETKRN